LRGRRKAGFSTLGEKGKLSDYGHCCPEVDSQAAPKEKSIRRFMDQVRQRTKRKVPLTTQELIAELNPLLRGWGEYYKRAHVRRLFHRLDAWIVHRLWSHRHKRWRTCGWQQLPETKLYGECGLVNLVGLIPSLASQPN
jgi:RNA-directed DNA polymerase